MDPLVPRELTTERLLLRQFREADCEDLHTYYGDPEATAFTTQEVYTLDQTWRVVATMIGHWQLRGYGPYAVEERASGRVLGPVGFWYPRDWPSPEIKWALARAHWGKGFASEFVGGLVRWCLTRPEVNSLVGGISSSCGTNWRPR